MTLNNTAKFNILSNSHYCEFEWIIDNFSNFHQDLLSPEFSASDHCPVKWKAVLELKNSHQSNLMRIKYCITENNARDLKAKFFYKIFGGDKLIKRHSFEDIIYFIKKNQGIEIIKPQYLRNRGWAVDGCFNGVLSDRLRIEGTITVQNCCQKNDFSVVNENTFQLQIDFKSLFKNQEFTDVALNVENEVVRAHKFVLCARSPVFRAMFEQDFTESIHNAIYIHDMQKSILETFLEFLYTGEVKINSFKTATDLYSAADKYGVTTLQVTCRETLLSYISKDSVTIILKLADMHNDNILKEKAIIYICNNFSDIESTNEWRELIDTDPQLASYALSRVSKSMIK